MRVCARRDSVRRRFDVLFGLLLEWSMCRYAEGHAAVDRASINVFST
jgi:hypothetical protein